MEDAGETFRGGKKDFTASDVEFIHSLWILSDYKVRFKDRLCFKRDNRLKTNTPSASSTDTRYDALSSDWLEELR